MKKFLTITSTLFLMIHLTAQTVSEKRGFGGDILDKADAQASSKYGWYYNWGLTPNTTVKDSVQDYINYVPMIWGANFDQQALIDYLTDHPEVKYLLGFNEPNFIEQSNLTPTQAAAAWPQVEAIADQFNLTIVGPALNYCYSGGAVSENGVEYIDPLQWYDDFFAACPDCRVDHIAIHGYFDNAAALPWYIGLFEKYNKPIWLTEFNQSASWVTEETQKAYMKEAIEYLENEPMVFRYAWFLSRSSQLNTNLFENDTTGVLTQLGELYTELPGEGLKGFSFASDESGTVGVTGIKDVAYGANGQYVYLNNQTQDCGCNTNTFGSDPIFGVEKHCYTRPSGPEGYIYSCKEGQNVSVTGSIDVAYGANGQFYYLYNQTKDVGCNSTVFGGDPIFGEAKLCYVKASEAPDTIAPTVPTDLVTNAAVSSISMAWTASGDNIGVSGYNLYINGSYLGSTASTSYIFDGLRRNNTYQLGVSAYDDAGNESSVAIISVKTTRKSTTVSAESNSSDNIYTYPNPVSDYLYITYAQKGDKIEIYDISGHVLVTTEVQSSDAKIDVSDLDAGLYILKISSENNVKTFEKIIKK